MAVEPETLRRVAGELAALPVPEEDLASVQQQVERGVEAVRALDELDLTGVEPPLAYRVI